MRSFTPTLDPSFAPSSGPSFFLSSLVFEADSPLEHSQRLGFQEEGAPHATLQKALPAPSQALSGLLPSPLPLVLMVPSPSPSLVHTPSYCPPRRPLLDTPRYPFRVPVVVVFLFTLLGSRRRFLYYSASESVFRPCPRRLEEERAAVASTPRGDEKDVSGRSRRRSGIAL